MRGCRRARKAIRLVMDGELRLEERFALDDHTARCPDCRREHVAAQRLEEALEVLPEPAMERVDTDRALVRIHDGIAAGSRRTEPVQDDFHFEPHRKTWRMWRLSLSGVAALAVLVLLVDRLGEIDRPGDAFVVAPQESLTLSGQVVSYEDADQDTVRDAVIAALLDAYADDANESNPARHFDESTRPIARAGWPVLRFVEGLLAEDSSELLAATIRYLGERGDANSANGLERVLGHEELRSEAFIALGRLGQAGLPVLSRIVGDPDHAVPALQVLVRIGGEDVAGQLEELLARKSRGEQVALSRATLLDGLSQTGPFALDRLVAMAESGRATHDEVLSRLHLVRDGGRELAHRLEAGKRPSEVVYAALAILQPPDAFVWLEERCEETRERERALACISRWSGSAPCELLLRLHVAGRVDEDAILGTMRDLAERNVDAMNEFTESLVLREAQADASVWLELLFATEHEGAATSLALLAIANLLHPDERQWAALAVGEFGATTGARTLLAGFREIDAKERRLRAAVLISIHALLGEAGIRSAVHTPRQGRDAGWSGLLASLDEVDRRDRTAYGVHRVARALDKCHDSSATPDSLLLP